MEEAKNSPKAAYSDCFENNTVDCLPNLSDNTIPTSYVLFCFRVALGYSISDVSELTVFWDMLNVC